MGTPGRDLRLKWESDTLAHTRRHSDTTQDCGVGVGDPRIRNDLRTEGISPQSLSRLFGEFSIMSDVRWSSFVLTPIRLSLSLSLSPLTKHWSLLSAHVRPFSVTERIK